MYGIDYPSWAYLLDLARLHGWQGPAWADGQTVTAEEAGALALAVERAIDDIPDHDALKRKARYQDLPEGGQRRIITEGTPVNACEWYSGPCKDFARLFPKWLVDHAEAGPLVVRIW